MGAVEQGKAVGFQIVFLKGEADGIGGRRGAAGRGSRMMPRVLPELSEAAGT